MFKCQPVRFASMVNYIDIVINCGSDRFAATTSDCVVTSWQMWSGQGEVGLSDHNTHSHSDAVLQCDTDGGTLVDYLTHSSDTNLGSIMLGYKNQGRVTDYEYIWTLGSK